MFVGASVSSGRGEGGLTNSPFLVGCPPQVSETHLYPEYVSRVLLHITQVTCKSDLLRSCSVLLLSLVEGGGVMFIGQRKDERLGTGFCILLFWMRMS